MKKNISVFIFLIFAFLVKAQNIADYKYISVPKEFNDFKDKKNYGLSNLLQKSLKTKQYTVLSESKEQWPEEAIKNPCNILNADILDDKGFLRNKLILQFKNCEGKAILSEKAGSNIKEFEEGFQDALRQTFVKIPVSNPKAVAIIKKETPNQDLGKANLDSKSEKNTAQRFSDGKITLQKIMIDDHQFILVEAGDSVPFASFRETTKKDVFRVKLKNGTTSIAYYDNGSIVIEIPTANGDFAKEVFSKL